MIDPAAAKLAAGRLGPSLVDPTATGRLDAAARAMPAGALAQVIEVRTGAANSAADLRRFTPAQRRRCLRWRKRRRCPARRSPLSPGYSRIAPMLRSGRRWCGWRADLHDGAPAAPSVFLAPPNPEDPGQARSLVQVLARALNFSKIREDAALAVIAGLPQGVTVRQIGAMTSRADAPMRLVLQGLDAAMLPALAGSAGADAAGRLAQARLFEGRPVRAHLDVLDGIGPRIGAEIATAGADAAELARLADALLADGLANADAARAIARLAPPVDVPGAAQPGWRTALRLNHLKISADGVSPAQAKAYFIISPQPDPGESTPRRTMTIDA